MGVNPSVAMKKDSFDISQYLKEKAELVNLCLDNYFSESDTRMPKELLDAMRYSLLAGGKRLRPVLMLMACNLFSDDIEKAIKPALGIEIFHNFTLVHDDIMDNASKRRGRVTVHKKYDLTRN